MGLAFPWRTSFPWHLLHLTAYKINLESEVGDTITWKMSPSGIYSTKSACLMLSPGKEETVNSTLSLIWKLRLPHIIGSHCKKNCSLMSNEIACIWLIILVMIYVVLSLNLLSISCVIARIVGRSGEILVLKVCCWTFLEIKGTLGGCLTCNVNERTYGAIHGTSYYVLSAGPFGNGGIFEFLKMGITFLQTSTLLWEYLLINIKFAYHQTNCWNLKVLRNFWLAGKNSRKISLSWMLMALVCNTLVILELAG